MVDKSEKESQLYKTFSGTLDKPGEMEKARALVGEPQAPVDEVVRPSLTIDVGSSKALDRQALVAQKFEVGMDKITDVLLVVGLKLSRTAQVVVGSLVGVIVLVFMFAVTVLVLMSKLQQISDRLEQALDNQDALFEKQQEHGSSILDAAKKADEARARAELAAKQLKDLQETQPTVQVEKGKATIEFPQPGTDEKKKIVLPRSSLRSE